MPLIKLLLKLNPRLPERVDDYDQTALFISVKEENSEAVRFFCKALPPEVMKEVFRKSSKYKGNCLHVAIKENLPFLYDLLEKVGKDEEVSLKEDEDGNTPLHIAVEYPRCKGSQFNLVQRLVEASNASLAKPTKAGLPPLRYYIETRKMAEKEEAAPKRKGKNPKVGEEKKPEAANIVRRDQKVTRSATVGPTGVLAGTETGKKDPNMQSAKQVIVSRDGEVAKLVENFLRLETMRNRGRIDTRKLLYETGQSAFVSSRLCKKGEH
jgi:hypothetical protein